MYIEQDLLMISLNSIIGGDYAVYIAHISKTQTNTHTDTHIHTHILVCVSSGDPFIFYRLSGAVCVGC